MFIGSSMVSISLDLRGGRSNDEIAEFSVDSFDARYGGLGLSVGDPSNVEINCVELKPLKPEQFLINVTYVDVPGLSFKSRGGDRCIPAHGDMIVTTNEDEVKAEFED